MPDAPAHPATFSPAILETIQPLTPWQYLPDDLVRGIRVLDPFGGVGTIQSIFPGAIVNELELEWLTQAPVHGRLMAGDATSLALRDGSIDMVITSPCYGNRMADHHDAREKCKACKGAGRNQAGHGWVDCEKCKGTGARVYKRITYKHYLGRDLRSNNAGAMQWGPAYRQLHVAAWAEVRRVLRRGGLFVLNISDHWRKGAFQDVPHWHQDVIIGGGGFERFEPLCRDVETPRMRFGANAEHRAEVEHIWVYRRL